MGVGCAFGAMMLNAIVCSICADTRDTFLITNAILMAALAVSLAIHTGTWHK